MALLDKLSAVLKENTIDFRPKTDDEYLYHSDEFLKLKAGSQIAIPRGKKFDMKKDRTFTPDDIRDEEELKSVIWHHGIYVGIEDGCPKVVDVTGQGEVPTKRTWRDFLQSWPWVVHVTYDPVVQPYEESCFAILQLSRRC